MRELLLYVMSNFYGCLTFIRESLKDNKAEVDTHKKNKLQLSVAVVCMYVVQQCNRIKCLAVQRRTSVTVTLTSSRNEVN